MWKCPRCGNSYPQQIALCSGCGYARPPATTAMAPATANAPVSEAGSPHKSPDPSAEVAFAAPDPPVHGGEAFMTVEEIKVFATPDPPVYRAQLVPILTVGGILVFLTLAWLANTGVPVQAGARPGLAAAHHEETAPARVAKAITDEERLANSKTALTDWQGEPAAYSAAVSSLKSLAANPKLRPQAIELISKWSEKRRALHIKHEQEDRIAAHRAQQEERQARLDAAHDLRQAREDARYFTGEGGLKIAIATVKLHHSTEFHVARDGMTFVNVWVDAKNFGSDAEPVNPNDFTLADTEGNTVPYDADTFETGKPVDAETLSSGQQAGGWLTFYARKDNRYKLTRRGFDGDVVEKDVIP